MVKIAAEPEDVMLNVNLRLKGVTESKEAEHSTLEKGGKKCDAKGKTAAFQMVQCDCSRSSILAMM